jgi:hypothetical protein
MPADTKSVGPILLRPIDIRRIARVPYRTVIKWIEVGHPRAGLLPSIDFAATRKRHSYRIRPSDWEAFQAKLTTEPRARRTTEPMPRPLRTTGPIRF